MHEKVLQVLQDFIVNHASDEQVRILHEIAAKKRSFPDIDASSDSSGKVFVSMPMNVDKYSCVDVIRDGMKRGVELTGNTAYFFDMDMHCEDIPAKMLSEIRACKFLVADFTDHVTGVYYEAGYAAALGKTVIHTCRDIDMFGLHFDISHIQAVVWHDADELAGKLASVIRCKGLNID